MLTLCGFSVSNYHNKVKFALLEKGVSFEEQVVHTGKEAIAAGNPMGKVPFLKTPHGILLESIAICDYIEDIHPNPPLYPRDPYARAKCRELVLIIELYLELAARRLHPEVYFGGKVSDEIKQSARTELEKGIKGLAQAVKFGPHILGSDFTYADCAAYAHLPLVSQCTKKIYGEDFLERVPGMAAYMEQLRARPHAKKVNDDRKMAIAKRA